MSTTALACSPTTATTTASLATSSSLHLVSTEEGLPRLSSGSSAPSEEAEAKGATSSTGILISSSSSSGLSTSSSLQQQQQQQQQQQVAFPSLSPSACLASTSEGNKLAVPRTAARPSSLSISTTSSVSSDSAAYSSSCTTTDGGSTSDSSTSSSKPAPVLRRAHKPSTTTTTLASSSHRQAQGKHSAASAKTSTNGDDADEQEAGAAPQDVYVAQAAAAAPLLRSPPSPPRRRTTTLHRTRFSFSHTGQQQQSGAAQQRGGEVFSGGSGGGIVSVAGASGTAGGASTSTSGRMMRRSNTTTAASMQTSTGLSSTGSAATVAERHNTPASTSPKAPRLKARRQSTQTQLLVSGRAGGSGGGSSSLGGAGSSATSRGGADGSPNSSTLANADAKVVFIGSQGVGKTTLVTRYTHGQFVTSLQSTVGACFASQTVQTEQGAAYLGIWDTAGQERYQALGPLYYRDCNAAVIVYDIQNEQSFLDLQGWFKRLHDFAQDPGMTIHVVGAKADAPLSKRIITPERARRDVALWLSQTFLTKSDPLNAAGVRPRERATTTLASSTVPSQLAAAAATAHGNTGSASTLAAAAAASAPSSTRTRARSHSDAQAQQGRRTDERFANKQLAKTVSGSSASSAGASTSFFGSPPSTIATSPESITSIASPPPDSFVTRVRRLSLMFTGGSSIATAATAPTTPVAASAGGKTAISTSVVPETAEPAQPSGVASNAGSDTGESGPASVPMMQSLSEPTPSSPVMNRSGSLLAFPSATPTSPPPALSSSFSATVEPPPPTRSGSRLSLSLAQPFLGGFSAAMSPSSALSRSQSLTRSQIQRAGSASESDAGFMTHEQWVNAVLSKCRVYISECSAVTNQGVDELFETIARVAIERRAEIQHARQLRTRDSVILDASPSANDPTAGSSAWCCNA